MIRCRCCGYECDCMDLYYDHIMFDKKHQEMAQREANEAASVPSRRSRTDLRGKRTSLLYSRRRQCLSTIAQQQGSTDSSSDTSSIESSVDSSPVVAPKQSLVVGNTGY